MNSLNDYAHGFHKALKNRTPYSNYNRDMQHATIIVCTAFRHAEKRIRLVSRELDPQLYGTPWFRDAARCFLDQSDDTSLVVLVERDVAPKHPVKQLAQEYGGRVAVKRVPDFIQDEYPFNFMLVDDVGYRLEYDRAMPAAFVSFHNGGNETDQEILANLNDWFDYLEGAADSAARIASA